MFVYESFRKAFSFILFFLWVVIGTMKDNNLRKKPFTFLWGQFEKIIERAL